jgi:hypothetical protein
MEWFENKGIVAGNPEEIWVLHNQSLHRKTSEVIRDMNEPPTLKSNSSLLQRRLSKIMTLNV